MTQALPYLALADGVDTITLMPGSTTPGDFTLNRRFWSPQIASLRPNRIGGRGAYQEVVEELDINVSGSTVAAAYANLETLNRMLDRAERWANAEYTSTYEFCSLRYAPQGSTASSTATFLRSIVLGRAPGDMSRAPVELPPTFSETGLNRYALGVRVRLLRRGRWLLNASTNYASSSVSNSQVMSCASIPAHNTMSPVYDLSLTGFNSANNSTISAGYLAVGCLTTDVIRVENMSGATATGYTTQNDSANLPRGGTNVLRYTPSGTAAASSGWTPGSPVDAESDSPVAVLAVCRNNHASRVFQLRVDLRGYGVTVSTPYATVEAGDNQPQIVRLGIVRHPSLFNQIRVTCAVDSISGSPTLDIDYIVLVALHNQSSRLIQHDAIDISSLASGSSVLRVQVRQDSRLTPRMIVDRGSGAIAVATYYDPIDLEMIGTIYRVAWFATRANYWRFTTSAGAVVNLTADVTRSPAYLGPQ